MAYGHGTDDMNLSVAYRNSSLHYAIGSGSEADGIGASRPNVYK